MKRTSLIREVRACSGGGYEHALRNDEYVVQRLLHAVLEVLVPQHVYSGARRDV